MKLILCSLFASLLLMSPAHAKLYKWVDSDGKIRYSDKPPISQDRSISVLNKQGTITDKIETSEERKNRLAKEKADKEAAEQARLAKAKDNYLLSTYSSVAQIEQKKQDALSAPKRAITASQKRKQEIQAQINSTKDQRDIAVLNNQLTLAQREIDQKHIEIRSVTQRFDLDIARFKELKGLN